MVDTVSFKKLISETLERPWTHHQRQFTNCFLTKFWQQPGRKEVESKTCRVNVQQECKRGIKELKTRHHRCVQVHLQMVSQLMIIN